MREIGDMVDDNLAQGPIGLRLNAFPTGRIRISNRKYFAVSDLRFLRFQRFLIYGSAIKTPRKALKT